MFELKVSAPGLETAINNLAAAISASHTLVSGASAHVVTIGNPTAGEVVTGVIGQTIGDDSEADDEPGATGAEVGAVDAWGLPWNEDIHSKAADKIAKGTGQWKKRKGVEETFFQRTQTEMIKAAVAAGTYKGPENLIPKPEGYVAPVVTQDPATGVLIPVPPATTTAPVPPAPATATTAVVPPAPTTAPVSYTADVLQSAVMKMFNTPGVSANAGTIPPRLLKLYEVETIQGTPPEKIESFVKLTEKIAAQPDQALAILDSAEAAKAMGMPF